MPLLALVGFRCRRCCSGSCYRPFSLWLSMLIVALVHSHHWSPPWASSEPGEEARSLVFNLFPVSREDRGALHRTDRTEP